VTSVEEYLNGSYSPEYEYVDGALIETDVGDLAHANAKGNVSYALASKYPMVKVLPTLTTKINETRYRLPDVCVLLKKITGRFLEEPPFVAIEILSEGDRMSRMLEKLQDYADFRTPHIWVLDPSGHELYVFERHSLTEIKGDVIATGSPRLELTRDEIFRD
jgi:Uma2 family endonuclease